MGSDGPRQGGGVVQPVRFASAAELSSLAGALAWPDKDKTIQPGA
jgi:hypothetical protein